jgi:hypothetical protein
LIRSEVHNSWWRNKKKQGFVSPRKYNKKWNHGDPLPIQCNEHNVKCHSDMIKFEDLPKHIQKVDIMTVRTTIKALEEKGYTIKKIKRK